MNLREYHEKLRPFVFHGVDLDNDSKQAQGTCPFCLKPQHFGVETETGRWRCVRCDKSGNIYAFLRLLYEHALETCSPDLLAPLSEERGISVASLRKFGVTACPNGEYVVPAYNYKSVLSNLSKIVYNHKTGKYTIMSTPGCNQWPFGHISNPPKEGPLWILEGLWDAAKQHEVLSSTCLKEGRYVLAPSSRSLIQQCDILGLPGCKTFNRTYLPFIKDREVILITDSDHPDHKRNGVVDGHDGIQKVLEVIHEEGIYPSSLRCVSWGPDGYDPELPDGYDVRDLHNDRGPRKGLAYLDSILKTTDLNPPSESYRSETTTERKPVEIVECTSFQKLVDSYSEHLKVTQAFRDTLAICCAANLSVTVPGDQLWFRIIGPPGSGKSTLAMSFCGSETCVQLSKLTGFHSGYVGTASERKKGDAALIPQLHNKMVWTKDADTILTSPQRDTILGELRDLYEGESSSSYRNRKKSSYSGHRMALTWCGTDVLRTLNRTSLGERFLDCDIFTDKDQTQYLQAARKYASIAAGCFLSGKQHDPRTLSESLKGITAGFLKFLWDRIGSYPDIIFPKESEDAIDAMGQFLSFVRATIDRQGHDMAYRPRRELGTRLVSQFTRLATCLACVLEHYTLDDTILRILRKVMCDTAKGFRMEIIQQLYTNKHGLTADTLHLRLNLPVTTIRNHLRDMLELGIIRRVEENNHSGIRGRKVHYLQLTSKVRSYYKIAMNKD